MLDGFGAFCQADQPGHSMTETRVADIYDQIKAKSAGFGIRPGTRINEGALARELNVSRTPVREALNRLVAEQLIDFRPGTGFFCRPLDPQDMFDLYEMRNIVETAAVRLAVLRARDIHNWAEVSLDGKWRVVDPQNRRNRTNEHHYIAMRVLGAGSEGLSSTHQMIGGEDGLEIRLN